MNPHFKLLIGLTLTLLTGCNTAYFNPKADFSKDQLKPDEGIICGTIYNFNPRFEEISSLRIRSYDFCALKYRAINQDSGNVWALGVTRGIYALKNHTVTGRAFVIPIKAGEYEIYSYYLASGNGLATYSFTPVEEFSIKFKVNPGEIVYLGQIACTNDYSTAPGYFWLDGGHWEFSDNSANDLPKLASLYPNIDWMQATISPIQVEGIPNLSIQSTTTNYLPLLPSLEK